MIIYDIPKEFRQSIKIDLSNNFVRVVNELFYISIRDKVTDSELKFFCLSGCFTLKLQDIKDAFPENEIKIIIISDSRKCIAIDYSKYDIEDYKNVEYIRSGL